MQLQSQLLFQVQLLYGGRRELAAVLFRSSSFKSNFDTSRQCLRRTLTQTPSRHTIKTWQKVEFCSQFCIFLFIICSQPQICVKCIRNFILDDGINPQFLQQNMIEKVAYTEYWLNKPRISKVFSAGQFIGWLHGIVLRWIWQIMLCFLSNSSLQMSDNPVYYR